jgi:hypothetical protein
MALQARSEATRQKILDATIDLFSHVGYGRRGRRDHRSCGNDQWPTFANFLPASPLRHHQATGSTD